MADILDSIIDDQIGQQQKTGALGMSLGISADSMPDEEATFQKISKRSGIPVEAIRQDKGAEAKRIELLNSAETITATSPKVGAFLSDPENAKVSYDDIAALSKIEGIFSKPVDVRGIASRGDRMTAQDAQQYKALAGQAVEKALPSAGKGINEAIYNINELTGFNTMLRATGIDNDPGRMLLDNVATYNAMIGDIERVKPKSTAQNYAQMTFDTLAANALTAPLAAAGKIPMLIGFAATAPGNIEDYLKAGYSPAQSAFYSMSNKAMEGLTEMIGVQALFKAGKSFSKRAAEFIGGDLFGEEVNTLYSYLLDKGTIKPELTVDDFKKQVLDTAIVTALAGGGQVAMTQPLAALSIEFQRAASARQNQNIMAALGEAATESKLQTRLPEKFREFVASAKEDGDIQNTYIPAEEWRTYWQEKNVDPQQMADQITDDGGEQYMEALSTGGDIVIPIEAYAERLAATEHHTDLARHIRLRQGDMTLAEAEQFDSEREAKTQEIIDQLQSEIATAQTERPSWMKVYDDLYGQLQGVYDRSTAEKYATLEAIRYRTRAERLGVDALDLYNESPLKVTRPLPDALRMKTVDTGIDPLLDTLRSGNPLDENDPNIQTLAELRGELDSRNIDLNQMDNEAVRGQLFQGEGGELWQKSLTSSEFIPERLDDLNRLVSISSNALSGSLNGESIVSKSLVDGTGKSAKRFGNLLKRYAMAAEENGLIGTPSFVSVLTHVQRAIIDQSKIIDAIIGSVSIDMVNNLFGSKSAAKMLLHNEAMLKDSFTFNANLSVSGGFGDTPPPVLLLISNATFEAAKTITGLVPVESRLELVKNSTTSSANTLGSFSQGKPPEKLASIQFVGGTSPHININILENANLSSLLHELSHSWLEELKQDAKRPDAPEQLKQDWATVKKYLSVEGDVIPVEAHELFARAGEAYVMEGKSPSAELQGVFQRFKAWLTRIYREFSGLNVKLNDDVRGVFDRLLATDEEIASAEKAQGYTDIFATAQDAGMTEAEFAAYKKTAQNASQEARDTLQKKLMAELSREQKEWWKNERAKMREGVEQEAKESPVYQVFNLLTKGELFDGTKPEGDLTWKLNKAELVKMYGEPFLKRLPRGFGFIYTTEGGVSPDFVAEMFGFSSGDEMVRKLIEAPKMRSWIEAETDIRMKEQYGDMLNDGSIAEEAIAAVHNDTRGDVLRVELRAIRKRQREVAPHLKAKDQEEKGQRKEMFAEIPPVKYFRLLAAQTIGQKLVMDIDPQLYLHAERKAGKLAFEAAAKGDYAVAGEQKYKQLLNHYLYKAASDAREEADTIRDYMADVAKRKNLGRIGKASPEFLDQVDAILERYEFVKVPLRELRDRQALGEWLDSLSEEYGLDIPVDASLLDMHQVNYRQIPMDELRSVYDSVRAIVHAARLMNGVRNDLEEMALDDAEQMLVERAHESIPESKPMRLTDSSMSMFDKIGEAISHADISLLRPERLMEWLDGGSTGPWHDFLWNRAVDADNKRNELRGQVLPQLQALLDGMGKDRKARLNEKREIKALGESLTYYEMIGIALNTGNQSNLEKMMKGGLWFGESKKFLHSEAVAEILGNLDEQDAALIQGMWDAVNSLWPDIAKIEQQRSGLEPVKVEAQPITVGGVELKGGYWPVVYDSRHSVQGEKQSDSNRSADQMFGANFTKASTRKGHTKERVQNFSRPLQLDWRSVVSRHVDNVITDISHWEFVFQARRILARESVQKAVQTRIGDTAFRSLEGWLKYTVQADYFGDPAAAGWQKARQIATSNLAVAALGFKVMTAVGNIVVAPVQAGDRISPKYIARGIGEFLHNPSAAMQAVRALSGQMMNRQLEVDKTLQETINSLSNNDSIRAQIARASMSVHLWADRMATTGLWLGAYREALDKGDTEIEAIRAADKSIRMTQTAGAPKDLSAFERHPMSKEVSMFLGPMLIMGNGIRSVFGSKGGVQLWTPEAWGKLFALWFGPAIIFELVVGRGPEDDDDPESWAKWGLTKILLYPLQTIPLIRDMASTAEALILGHRAPTSRGLPVQEAGKSIIEAARKTYKAIEGEGDTEKAVKADVSAAGLVFGLPSGQLSITGEFLYDVLSGNYNPQHPWSPARDLLIRRKENK